MSARILIVEGDPPELALAAKRGAGATFARGVAAALRELDEALTFDFAEPLFSDHDLGAVDFAACDGVVFADSDVRFSAADPEARPFLSLCAAALDAGLPVFGAGWGMEIGAATLGSDPGARIVVPEAPFARGVETAPHPMTAGRRSSFDVVSFSGAPCAPPPGAEVTARGADGEVHAFATMGGGAAFWGVRHQPASTLAEAAYRLDGGVGVGGGGRPARSSALGRDLRLIGQDPIAYARLAAKRRVGLDVLDRPYHMTELANWLAYAREQSRAGPAP